MSGAHLLQPGPMTSVALVFCMGYIWNWNFSFFCDKNSWKVEYNIEKVIKRMKQYSILLKIVENNTYV